MCCDSNLCYAWFMKCRYFSALVLFMGFFGFCWGVPTAPAWAQEAAQKPAKEAPAEDGKRKTETFENLSEHFEGDKDTRGFPLKYFPQGTKGSLLLAAVGAGAVGGLLAVGGGSIAMVNYETQTSPAAKPDERLAARSAGRVGLGVFGLGALLMFAPPLLADWALPEAVEPAPPNSGFPALLSDPALATPVDGLPADDASKDLKKIKKQEEKAADSPEKPQKKTKKPQQPPTK